METQTKLVRTTLALMKGEFYYKNIDLHIHAVFLLVWMMGLYSSYFSIIIVRPSYVKYATLL